MDANAPQVVSARLNTLAHKRRGAKPNTADTVRQITTTLASLNMVKISSM